PVPADETTVCFVTLELIDDLEEWERFSPAVMCLDGELARIFALPATHLCHLVERNAESLGDEIFRAGKLSARGAGNLDRQHDLLSDLRLRPYVLHLADGLDLAWHSDQGDALEAGIAEQLKVWRKAVACPPAADHLVLAVGQQRLGHPSLVRVSPHDNHGIG